jgi:hypothetical protein
VDWNYLVFFPEAVHWGMVWWRRGGRQVSRVVFCSVLMTSGGYFRWRLYTTQYFIFKPRRRVLYYVVFEECLLALGLPREPIAPFTLRARRNVHSFYRLRSRRIRY